MREAAFLEIINSTLTDSSFIGDDCAYLKEYGLTVTQDTLVEDVHFTLSTISPYLLGKKSVNVNLSDIAASASQPLFITVSLSLPSEIEESFVKEFYKGIDSVCIKHNVKVIGGDLTASDKVVVSITAIGKKLCEIEVSRSYAKQGDLIVTTGYHGDSAGGLKLLQQNKNSSEYLIQKHCSPIARLEKSKILVSKAKSLGINKLAMMDTSDGLGDAIYKLSKGCGYEFEVDYAKIPVSDELKQNFPDDYMNLVMWGGEDFELLFTVPKALFDILDKSLFFNIGTVSSKPVSEKSEAEYNEKSFKHFKDI